MPHIWLPMFLVAPLAFTTNHFIDESVGMDSSVLSISAALEQQQEQQIEHSASEHLQTRSFHSLTSAVAFYQQLAASGQWRSIDSGPLLQLGDVHPQVPELKRLLYLYGDLDKASAEIEPLELFDAQTHRAVSRFQQRHGAENDGIVGPGTRRLLNISPQQRVDQLFLNQYRQKQLQQHLQQQLEQKGQRPKATGDYYLQVNIPEYRLRVYSEGNVILAMKTIIGRHSRQTPSFSSEVKSLIVNPFWNVPKSIAYRDILPRWQRDKTYLSRHNLKVVAGWELPRVFVPEGEIDLDKMYRGKEYHRLLEPPGHGNTLGRLKFQLSANNSIYLHDTKKPSLFEVHRRAMSSGCIRLEHPRKLANILLQHSNQWGPQQLEPLFEDTETHRIRLQKPIPIHVTYWTAWLDGQGVLHFADDLYHRDPVDLAQLKKQSQSLALQLN
jgi:murein L,D-transpeptidase YcbB/YkuD